MHWLDLHSFIWVQEIEPGLKLAVLHPNWLKKHVAEHPDAIGHEQARDGVMFTDRSSALQSFLQEIAEIPDAFYVMDPLVPAAK